MSDLIASYHFWSILSVFNFWFFPVFLHFWASIKSKFHTLISFTWKLLIQPFTRRLSFDVKLCSLWSLFLSHTYALLVYTWAWNVPDDPLSHVKGLWKVERMIVLAVPDVLPHIVTETIQNLPTTLTIADVPPGGLPSQELTLAPLWIGLMCLDEEALLFYSIPAVFWNRWGTYWSVGSRMGSCQNESTGTSSRALYVCCVQWSGAHQSQRAF